MFLKIICYFLISSSVGLIDAVLHQRCDYLTLPHGKVKYLYRATRARFTCFKPFTLIGSPRLDCENGEWNGQVPVCASKSCANIPNFHHGKASYFNNGALAELECDTNFTLIGSSNLVCEKPWSHSAPQWNYTEIPQCQANSIHQFDTCDYEPDDVKKCKWISKPGLFNWTVLSSDPKENTHMQVDSFPSHDHTLGSNSNGEVEILSNESSIWKSNSSLGTKWNKFKIPLQERTSPFRITIEGKGTLIYPTRTAIDDLRIASGIECLKPLENDEDAQLTQTSTFSTTETTTMTTDATTGTLIILDNSETTTELDQVSFTTLPPESQVVNTETPDTWTGSSHHHGRSNLTDINQIATINHNAAEFNSNNNDVSEACHTSIKIEHIKSPEKYEIKLTENNPINHGSFSEKNGNNDIIVEEDHVPVNSTLANENDNELRDSRSPFANSSSHEPSTNQTARDEKERQDLNNDFALLQHFLPKDSKGATDAPTMTTTRLTSVSNNTAVFNDTNYGHKKDENNRRAGVKINRLYSGEVDAVRQQARKNEKNVIEDRASDFDKSNNSNDSKMIWVISSVIICVMLITFFVAQGYKKYHIRKRKDDSSILFFKKNSGNPGSRNKKDDILMLDCGPKKIT